MNKKDKVPAPESVLFQFEQEGEMDSDLTRGREGSGGGCGT